MCETVSAISGIGPPRSEEDQAGPAGRSGADLLEFAWFLDLVDAASTLGRFVAAVTAVRFAAMRANLTVVPNRGPARRGGWLSCDQTNRATATDAGRR